MDVAGERMAQGGIFEVAEAYWNFWYFGAFFVPLVITYLMGSLLRHALRSPTAWFFAAISFITIMLMTPRGVWYQTFAYWRTVTVIVVLYLIIKLAHGLISSNRARAGKKVRFSHS